MQHEVDKGNHFPSTLSFLVISYSSQEGKDWSIRCHLWSRLMIYRETLSSYSDPRPLAFWLHKADTRSCVPSHTAWCCDVPWVTHITRGCRCSTETWAGTIGIFGMPSKGSGLQVPHSHSGKMAPPAGDAGTVLPTCMRSNAPSGVSMSFFLAPLQTSIQERFLFNVVPV